MHFLTIIKFQKNAYCLTTELCLKTDVNEVVDFCAGSDSYCLPTKSISQMSLIHILLVS